MEAVTGIDALRAAESARVPGIGGPDDNVHGAESRYLRATPVAGAIVAVVCAAGFVFEVLGRTPVDERGFLGLGIITGAMVGLTFGVAAVVGGLIAWGISSSRPTSPAHRALLGAVFTVAPVAALGALWRLASDAAPWSALMLAALAGGLASAASSIIVDRRRSIPAEPPHDEKPRQIVEGPE